MHPVQLVLEDEWEVIPYYIHNGTCLGVRYSASDLGMINRNPVAVILNKLANHIVHNYRGLSKDQINQIIYAMKSADVNTSMRCVYFRDVDFVD